MSRDFPVAPPRARILLPPTFDPLQAHGRRRDACYDVWTPKLTEVGPAGQTGHRAAKAHISGRNAGFERRLDCPAGRRVLDLGGGLTFEIRQDTRRPMPASAHVVRRLFVEGFVQGVGYRAFARRAARSLGVSGWVRNRADGTVEALVSGRPDAIEAMLAELRRGPAGARGSRAPPGRDGRRAMDGRDLRGARQRLSGEPPAGSLALFTCPSARRRASAPASRNDLLQA